MSIDPSLKTSGALTRHRNVLTRAERITKLMEQGSFNEESTPTGLPKVASRKANPGKKGGKKGAKDEE